MKLESVGIVGMGWVGARFARKLLESGRGLTVFDIRPEKAEESLRLGAQWASSAREAAERSDVVLLCLPDSPAVEAAMEGRDGVLAGVAEGKVVVDTGTSRPETDIRYEAEVRGRGGAMLDAPITGRARGYIVMAGGAERDFERARPVLEAVGCRAVLVGPLGDGQRLKLVNQFILAARLSVLCEAAHLASRLGLDPALIDSVLEFPEVRGPLGREIRTPGAQLLALHTKDLRYLSELVERCGARAPLARAVTEVFRETRGRSEPDWNQTSVVTHWEAMAEH
jgi:3-hydroxyisobutyrate dehydrogenase-like beta-hydroxyacid dehydrogenase